MPKTIRIDSQRIQNAATFHAVFAEAFGFPRFYGRNMDAWIDCMNDLRDNTGMTNVRLGPDELVVVEIPDVDGIRIRCPDVIDSLLLCTAAVNQRFIAAGQPAAIALVFC